MYHKEKTISKIWYTFFMKLHRFYLKDLKQQGSFDITNIELIHQIYTVLRMEKDDSFIVFNGSGYHITVKIEHISKKELSVSFVEKTENTFEPKIETTLYVSILKRENTELILQKATELGITTIIPLLTTRTIKTGFNMERARRIVLEATEQSGRDIIPQISEPVLFSDALKADTHSIRTLFDPRGESYSFSGQKDPVSIYIGPEGGFTEEECLLAKNSGVHIASLDTPILRGETAGIVGVYKAVCRL